MKLKAMKKTNRAISRLVQPFGISKALMGSEYAYHFSDEHIDYAITCDDWTDIAYDAFLKEEFGFENPYPFVISILHEIGHHMTSEDIYDEYDYDEIQEKKTKIENSLKLPNKMTEKVKLEFDYFRLPDEYAATAWAVDYFKTHRAKCDKMYKRTVYVLGKFYKKNGVTED